MINQAYIDCELARNPSVSDLATLASLLEAHAEDCYAVAAAANDGKHADVCKKMYDVAQDALDTANAIYLIVYEAADYLVEPDEMLAAEWGM